MSIILAILFYLTGKLFIFVGNDIVEVPTASIVHTSPIRTWQDILLQPLEIK